MQGSLTVHGYVADPACDRGHAGLQYLFVNGRWVRDRGLAQALQEAYRGLLMTGRYAVAFLFLDLPPDAVDVNVHPTKSEVRLQPLRNSRLALSVSAMRAILAVARARLLPLPSIMGFPRSAQGRAQMQRLAC